MRADMFEKRNVSGHLNRTGWWDPAFPARIKVMANSRYGANGLVGRQLIRNADGSISIWEGVPPDVVKFTAPAFMS